MSTVALPVSSVLIICPVVNGAELINKPEAFLDYLSFFFFFFSASFMLLFWLFVSLHGSVVKNVDI